jgi:hypothetical protein
VEKVLHHMPLDPVADQMAVQFLQQRLPPPPLLPFKVGVGACPALPCTALVVWARPWLAVCPRASLSCTAGPTVTS